MRVAIAADHAGLPLREPIAEAVRAAGHEPLLLGPDTGDPVDYPLVAEVIGDAIATGAAERAILVCGSGAGVTVAANKLPLVRAAYGADHYTAHQMVEHDHVNVLTLGARVMGTEVATDVATAYVNAVFSGVERHARRLSEVLELERERSMNAATRLHSAGQSLWVDNITRAMLTTGTLARYIADDAVTGLTSNPTIFDKAIRGSADYDEQIRAALGDGKEGEEVFFELALDDLRRAAGLFRPVWDATRGVDGWVSLEVSPKLAYDTKSTVDEAKALHGRAEVPNLYIKVPGTPQGRPAITELIAAGVSVNVTLLFSPDHYRAAADAYMNGLEQRQAAGDPLDDVLSVASLFVSRWDAHSADKLPADLENTLGVAIGAQAYAAYRDVLASDRWKALEGAGARPQRLLFASTSAKDPALPKSFYVEALAAQHTVNTMPDTTLEAFVEAGEVGALLAPDGGDSAAQLDRIREAGVDVDALGEQLQTDGAKSFVDSWNDLLQCIGEKSEKLSAA